MEISQIKREEQILEVLVGFLMEFINLFRGVAGKLTIWGMSTKYARFLTISEIINIER